MAVAKILSDSGGKTIAIVSVTTAIVSEMSSGVGVALVAGNVAAAMRAGSKGAWGETISATITA